VPLSRPRGIGPWGWTPHGKLSSSSNSRFYGPAADVTLHFYDRACYAELIEALAGAADTGTVWRTSVLPSRAGH
jgi:hypothetical protein